MPQDEGAEGSRGAGVRRRRRLLVWVGVVLAAVLVDRRRRDAERLARDDARRARLVPADRLR